jgi:hypothetical protein
VDLSIGANLLDKCWYSGCNLIVQGMKYVLHRLLWDGGCCSRRLGIGPGFCSISPHFSSNIFMYLLFCFF